MTVVDESDAVDAASFSRVAWLTASFYVWENRGRGWQVWPYPVSLEPPFRPFISHHEPSAPVTDDARKPSWFMRWLKGLTSRDAIRPAFADSDEFDEPEAEPAASSGKFVELEVTLSPETKVVPELAEQFLVSLSSCAGVVSFEIVGTTESVTIQIACIERDASHVEEQFRAYFPDAVISRSSGLLERAWVSASGKPVIVDFGLSQEFMRPLKTYSKFDADPLIGVVGALSNLAPGEIAVMQVLVSAARAPWAASIVRAVNNWDGKAFFSDAPELVGLAEEKLERPLFATVLRVAVKGPTSDRALEIARRVGGALAQVGNPATNELIALANDEYPDEVHSRDLLERSTHRSGFLVNSGELVSLVHAPSSVVRSPRLRRDQRRTKAAPAITTGHQLVIGENEHGGTARPVTLGTNHRLRHMHVVGASGTGKSTLLLSLITQDMEQGRGIAVLDPHGDLIDHVLSRVPAARVEDVIVVDPADTERPIGFNILSAHSDLEKTLLSSDLVAVFKRLSTSWGDQMTSVLSNAVLAFLESSRGGTLADLRRFLIEAEYRNEFLKSVGDPEVVYYWQQEFSLLAGRPQAPLLTRLDTFLRPKLVRQMMAQPSNRLDFASIMNDGKILLVKLAQGAIGEENAALLGTLFVAKVHQLALGRQSVAEAERRPFFVYLDEFQHFVTPSMATLLTGARKYGVGLVLAHQELRQLWNQERDVAGAVLANAATRVCFRVGDDDAKKLEDGFSTFAARDLQNLGIGQAVCRVERAEWDFSLTTRPLPTVEITMAAERRAAVVQRSRERYGATFKIDTPASPTPRAVPPVAAADSVRDERASSESPTRALDTSPPAPSTETAIPATAGRGGAQHKYLQELIRRWADAKGWRATIEQQAFDGLGYVDVALENGTIRVAVEISVSSTTAYEVGNLQKCLAAGFDQVIAIVVDKRSLQRLRRAVGEQLPEAGERIHVLDPESLFLFLDAVNEGTAPKARTSRGYKVRVSYGRRNAGSASARTIAKTVVGALKRMGR